MKAEALFLALSAFVLVAASPVERVQTLPKEEVILALDIKFHPQIGKNSCGAAILHSVLSYWGSKDADQRDLLKIHPPSSAEGDYSIGEMKRIAKELGFKAYVVQATLSFIEKQLRLGRPVVVPVTLEYGKEKLKSMGVGEEEYSKISKKHDLRYNHFLAVIGMGKDSMVVLDPAKGIYLIEKKELERQRAPHKDAALLLAL
ncbi:MAG: cysteine peptidase family C39 domain-containing protein [Nitrospinota bacterium]|nr:cysteine peptidase family C39 domain-containing protein [Nitrospinota bacterium]